MIKRHKRRFLTSQEEQRLIELDRLMNITMEPVTFITYKNEVMDVIHAALERLYVGVDDKNKRSIPKNPNQRACVARNITFPGQRENEALLRMLAIVDRRNSL
ncbi:hypothetical protein [Mangrovibacillus cuniculi]|uniref:Uncharacterized protein n=1 Tax=Mangrovibacillus cuniculi TaxID=2593652 RepID=A0A7S8CDY2_9BACI|nr:hypothetical protein [Mangrovibacillus cuniculi]QPC48213.1 hypothetical protein G8O30_15460 [Mangrovibacillus cuniculi]